ncbi:AAA family ATPase [Longimicrobium terrae]|uniref:ABC-type taurine transport system ATPase subunit/peptidoglycan hydrolase CwlO-like protein n=1 Tax=Longimicrobium terrae TaxID=1639882 RepID=A0A841H5Z8_9BACT|nr:ATP-binding protein [Longimicrobium terrae]MBB4638930.1 ABC-type taurine transport system ATPase subunit/peptidoglycan hydrolase CwlO-like protein [Longimicrobium terrae]MBB6073169.1 ABC-type taurine transport system ATPase subunit/peptidoglycan hydrolase CwlO-like protein [Longimicrobium terrae]NNC30145.1 AAA family ATPase [Longimicrobium terrae]
MRIERLQVDEGFLDGLDLRLADGLNVLIGPRGAGKTSIIELVRFCLAAPGFSDRSKAQAKEHALSVLGSGQVTITLSTDEGPATVVRTASDAEPRVSGRFEKPLIFSQNEIETIGLIASSRLNLIDFFRTDRDKLRESATHARAEVRSLMSEMRALAQEITELEERAGGAEGLREQLVAAEEEQLGVIQSLGDAEGRWAELDALTSTAAQLAVRDGVYDRVVRSLETWGERAATLVRNKPDVEDWPEAAGGPDPIAAVRASVVDAMASVTASIDVLASRVQGIEELRSANKAQQIETEQQSRDLRNSLEQLQKGGTVISKRISGLREQIAQLDALTPLRMKKLEAWTTLRDSRDTLLDELDSLCEREYEERADVAARLNRQLGPTIRITVQRFGIHTEYVNTIRNVLRGTGLHYNTLAPMLAEKMSPREVLDAVESQDYETLSSIAGIPVDRAARLVAELSKTGTEELVTCELQDSVTLSLLDGGEYKSTEHLSTGQRCTVVLPILLAKEDRVLVVDQPEDHLDNGFIVGTAIEAIRKRKQFGQLIFSTHNPNIPVLGEASLIVLMGSDGRNGFVRHARPLDHPESVEAITTVMEGGLEAFHRRAEFYGDNAESR